MAEGVTSSSKKQKETRANQATRSELQRRHETVALRFAREYLGKLV